MDPIEIQEQVNAYYEICDYFDSVKPEIPDELEDYVDALNAQGCQEIFLNTKNELSGVIDDPENWLMNNKDIVEQYLEFQKTVEYQNSDGTKFKELLKKGVRTFSLQKYRKGGKDDGIRLFLRTGRCGTVSVLPDSEDIDHRRRIPRSFR